MMYSAISKIESNLHYARDITPKRVTSGGAHFCGLAPGKHSCIVSTCPIQVRQKPTGLVDRVSVGDFFLAHKNYLVSIRKKSKSNLRCILAITPKGVSSGGFHPHVRAWAIQFRKYVVAVVSRCRLCSRFDRPGN